MFASLLIFASQNIFVSAGGKVSIGLSQNLQLGMLVGSLGLGQAQDRNIRLTHEYGGESPELSRDPGLEQQLLKVGRGKTQLHFTSGNPILDTGTWPWGTKT